MFIKKFMPFFEAEGQGGGSGYMVSPEHLQNVYQNPDGGGNEPIPQGDGGQPPANSGEPQGQPTQEEIQMFDLGEGYGQLSREDVIKGFLRQQDYTRKTQDLSNERNAFTQERQQYEPVKELYDMLSQDPQLGQLIAQQLQQYYGGQNPQQQFQPQQPQLDPRYNDLQSQLEQQQQFIQQWQEQQAMEKAQKEWDTLAGKFPDAKDIQEQIYQFAIENKMNLENAYRLMTYDKVAQKTQEQMVANQRKKQVARTTAPANATGGNTPPSSRPQSYADVLRVLKEEGIKLTND